MARADEDTQVIQRADDPLSSWTAEEELEEQNGSEPAGPPAGSRSESSLIRTLRAKRAEAVAEHIYDLEVPGYDGLLVLRCGPLSGNELAALADKATNSKSPDRAFNANADLLLRACTEVMGRPAHGAEPETLDTDVGPVRIDHTLAEMIGVEVSSSRELLLKLWDRVPSPEISIGLAAAEYVEWVGEATRTIDDGFLGGIRDSDELTAAAALSMYGFDGWRFLTTADDTERVLLLALGIKAAELHDDRDQNLAVRIVNAYVKARRRG